MPTVDDEECPHGLDRAWCSICKAQAQKASGPAAGRSGPPARPATGRRPSPRPSSPRPAALEPTPARALARLRPSLFHVTALGAWPSIAELGLRTAAQLADLADQHPLTSIRADRLDLVEGDGAWLIRLRDQRPMLRAQIESHLDGVTLQQWLDLVNSRVYFCARQKDLTTLLMRYQNEGQDLVVFDTAKLLAAAAERVEVTAVSSGSPVAWGGCPCRGRDTFIPLPSFPGAAADIEEVTVLDGLASVDRLVTRVVRYHPDRSSEVLVD